MNVTTRIVATAAALVCLAGCATPEPALRPDRPAPVVPPDGYSESPVHSAPVPISACGGDPGRSLSPASLPPNAGGPALDRVRDPRHGLVVGLSQTAALFSRRDLVTGELTGFEIEIVKRIARDLFGDPNDPRLRLVTVPTASRLYSLDSDENRKARAERPDLGGIQTVDLAIADVSVTCTRVKTYGLQFSAPYLATNSGLMIRRGLDHVAGPGDLGGRKVCSGAGTTNLDDMIDFAAAQKRNGKTPLVPVSVTDTTDCLMLLQRGLVDAAYTDVLLLAAFHQQDPGMVLLDYRAPRYAEAAIAMSNKDDDLVRFVNGVLERMRADGSLQSLYSTWFGTVPGLLPLPPVRYSG